MLIKQLFLTFTTSLKFHSDMFVDIFRQIKYTFLLLLLFILKGKTTDHVYACRPVITTVLTGKLASNQIHNTQQKLLCIYFTCSECTTYYRVYKRHVVIKTRSKLTMCERFCYSPPCSKSLYAPPTLG